MSGTTRLAWLLSFGAGFLSLSQEILWVRLVGFLQQGVPQAFSWVLGLYLLGIAIGAALGKRLCESGRDLPRSAAVVLAGAGALDLVLPPLLAGLADVAGPARLGLLALLIVATAAAKAVLFPVAHHLGTVVEGGRLGRSLARVYGLNIAGATLGPLLTGFVLLDHLSLDAGFRLIGLCSLALAAAAAGLARPRLAAALALLVLLPAGLAVDRQAQAVAAAHAERPAGARLKSLVSNRHGLLHVVDGGAAGDIVYGGNVYDGRVNTDLAVNSNRIDRAYLVATLHPAPRRLLVIGLSSGAWLRVLAAMPGVESIDVVEINPGYETLVRGVPALAPVLDDPRVRLHIDDGRRWLNRHADARFDLIVMNTTFHWRANITNLLSQQFMRLAASRMAPGGLIAFNATGSGDALATAAAVFPHAYRWSNFVYASDHDFRAGPADPARLARLWALRADGRPLLQPDRPADREAVERLAAQPFVTLAQVAAQTRRPLEVIDDMAMQTEFRHGRGLRMD